MVTFSAYCDFRDLHLHGDTRADALAIGIISPCRLGTGTAAAGQLWLKPKFQAKSNANVKLRTHPLETGNTGRVPLFLPGNPLVPKR